MADHGPDNLQILICTGSGRAAKQFILDEAGTPTLIPYHAGKRFMPRVVSVNSFDDMATALENLAFRPDCFVIRGTLRDDVEANIGDDVYATVMRRAKGPSDPFRPVNRRWIAIDFDAIPAPAGTDPVTDPDDAVEYLIGLLPPEFHDVSCSWQWTASQGFKPDTLNARFWFWLPFPVGDKELHRWAEHVNAEAGCKLIDAALFNPVQPHYTAGPIFDGMVDPLPRRFGRRQGLEDEVAIVLPQPPDGTQQRRTAGTENYRDNGGVEGYLARMGDGDGLQGFHQPIKQAVASAVWRFGSDVDQEGLKARIRAAIEKASKRPDRGADLVRYASDEFLDSLISWAVDREQQRRGHADASSASAPTYPLPVTDVTEARARVKATAEHMIGEALAYWTFHDDYLVARALREAGLPVSGNLRGLYQGVPPVFGLRADCGIGKSQITRALLKRILQDRSGSKVIIATPTVELAEKAASDARAIGLKAVAIRGRDQPVPGWEPSHDNDKVPRMCGDLDAVKNCIEAVVGVENSACIHVENGVELKCSLFDCCSYQVQKSGAEQADLIYMAHQYLFHPKPAFVGTVSLLVIDESFWQAGLEGVGNNRITLTCAGLQATRFIRGRDGRVDDDATNDWNTYARRLATAIISNGEGWLARTALEAVGITQEIATEMRGLARRLTVNPKIIPGMDPHDRRSRSHRVREINQFSRKTERTWDAIVDMFAAGRGATGNILCGGIDRDQDGGDIIGARLLYRKNIHIDWDLPTLLLDATMRMELVQPYFWQVAVNDTPAVAMPHVTVRQVVDAPVSGHKLIDGEHRRWQDNTTAINHQTKIHRFVRIVARGKNQVLLVAQKKVEARLNAMGLPETVETTHFNATAGIDSWKAVDQLQAYGRTLPGPREVEFMAAALTGQAVPLSDPDGWYQRVPGAIAMADGTAYSTTMYRHWHPVAEAARWAICEGEAIQTIGRARGVNRTAADPCEIIIAADLPLPIAVHEVVPWQAPDRFDEMALRGAVLENASDMARAYPELWETPKAAEHDKARRTPPNAFIEILLKEFGGVLIHYQPVGAGHKVRRVWFDQEVIHDPRAWLEGRLGPLAKYEVLVEHESSDAATEPVS